MQDSKEKCCKLNSVLILIEFAKKIGIDKTDICDALCNDGRPYDFECVKKGMKRGGNFSLILTYEDSLKILKEAAKLHIKKIQKQKKCSAKQKIKNEMLKEIISNSNYGNDIFRALCCITNSPLINSCCLNENVENEFLDVLESLFYTISTESAYIFTQNIDVFSSLEHPDIINFCICIINCKQESKKALMDMDTSNTFGEIVQLLHNEPFQQWFKIRNANYGKLAKQELAKYEKNFKNYKISLDENCLPKSLKFYEMNNSVGYFLNEYWEKFKIKIKKFIENNPTTPIFLNPFALLLLSEIVDSIDNIDLLLGFLACTQPDQKRLLEKAQELSQKDDIEGIKE